MKNFEQTVKSMSAKQIIMSLVEGLQTPAVNLQMASFGMYHPYKKSCSGGAVTNMICRITGKVFSSPKINLRETRAKTLQVSNTFLFHFEIAIDCLRMGEIRNYNYLAKKIGLVQIHKSTTLPWLKDGFTTADLQQYIELAEAQ